MLGRNCSKAVVSSEWSGVDRGQEAGGGGRGPALEVSSRRPPGGGDNTTMIFLMRSQPWEVLGRGEFGVFQEQQGDLCHLSFLWG